MNLMPSTQIREVAAAQRLDNVRYAIRDLASVADEVTKRATRSAAQRRRSQHFRFQTPPHLVEAVYKAMRENKNGYAPSPGIPEALEAIRGEAERKGISTMQDVFVTSGASEAVDVWLTALVNPGEQILTPSPTIRSIPRCWPSWASRSTPYIERRRRLAARLVDIQHKINSRTRAIVLINPNNPTGAVCSRRMLERLAELARRNNLVIFADEIYDKLILDDDTAYFDRGDRARCASGDFRRPIEELSGSGLAHRLGRGQRRCGRGEALHRGHSPLAAGAPVRQSSRTVRHQARAGRPAGSPGGGPNKLRARRDLTVKWCNSIPRLSCVPPRGAFYAFPRIDIPERDEVFVKELFRAKHVLVVHGSGFGQKPGTQHFRIVFLPDEPTLTKAYQAIGEFIAERYK